MLQFQRRLCKHGRGLSRYVYASTLTPKQAASDQSRAGCSDYLLPAGVVAMSMALIGIKLSECEKMPKAPGVQAGMPIISRAEVAKHKTLETGIWTTYQNGVYNITEFVANHPGGSGLQY
jgi:hypothetical protein